MFYASANYKARNKKWSDLSNAKFAYVSWFIYGNLNCVLNLEDKRGGRKFFFYSSTITFRNLSYYC